MRLANKNVRASEKAAQKPKGDKAARGVKLVWPALRRVLWSRREPAGDDVVRTEEMAGAPFALIVDYVPPSKGVYGVKLQVKTRDEASRALIARHGLTKIEIYRDKDADELDAYVKDKRARFLKGLEEDNILYVWSQPIYWDALRFWVGKAVKLKTVVITFGSLLEGVEVRGSFNTVRRVARAVTAAIDRIAADIEAGVVFDEAQTRVVAPGARQANKVVKPMTPPSQWRA